MKSHCPVLGLLATLFPASLAAQAPDTLSFQGRLTNPGGDPINTTTSMVFKRYKDNTEIWTEAHPAVTVTDGIFNVHLGGTTPLDTVALNRPIDVGIKVGGDEEISPRTRLTSTAYALGMRGMYAYWSEDAGFNRSYNVNAGASNNRIEDGVVGATISGGGGILFGSTEAPNRIEADFGTIGGGSANVVSGFDHGTIGGGRSNVVSVGSYNTLGGGMDNLVDGGNYATISGGLRNNAGGGASFVGGGIENKAIGNSSTVGGGAANVASGYQATVPGGTGNAARGEKSFAAGARAKANHDHSFVWNSAAPDTFGTTAAQQFLVRAPGGVGIGTNTPDAPLDIAGGNNWNLATTDGDVKIGDDTYRLEIGVALTGGGAGASRINAVGGIGALVLGGSETDVVRIDETNGLTPSSNNTYGLGSSSARWTEVFATNGTINTSDGRLKQDISDLSYGLSTVETLRPVSYRWKDRPASGERLGLIAQEVLDVIPEVVEVPDDPERYLGLRYAELVPVLIKAIKELKEITERQSEEIRQLQNSRIP